MAAGLPNSSINNTNHTKSRPNLSINNTNHTKSCKLTRKKGSFQKALIFSKKCCSNLLNVECRDFKPFEIILEWDERKIGVDLRFRSPSKQSVLAVYYSFSMAILRCVLRYPWRSCDVLFILAGERGMGCFNVEYWVVMSAMGRKVEDGKEE